MNDPDAYLNDPDGWIFLFVCLVVLAPFGFACARQLRFGVITSALVALLCAPLMLLLVGLVAALGVNTATWFRRHL